MTQLTIHSVHSVQSKTGQRIGCKLGVKGENLRNLPAKARGHLPRGFEKTCPICLMRKSAPGTPSGADRVL